MKKIFQIIALLLFFILSGISLFLYSIGMFKDNETFCSKYIPYIDQYYKIHGKYPENLAIFSKSYIDFNYNPKDCGYRHDKISYSFYGSDGYMGVVGYSSIDKKWWHD